MTLKKIYSVAFFVILSLFFSCNKEEADKTCNPDKYIFPIQPGSDEWKNLNSHKAMVDVCQIPEKTVKNMCTTGLIDTYFDYPLLFTIFAFNNTNEGLKQISEEFNGFEELLQRDNSASLLLIKYASINPTDVINTEWTDLEKGFFMQNLRILELTLGFEPIRNKLTKQERTKIIEIGLEKLEAKEENFYGGFSILTNIYLIMKILELEQYLPFMEYVNKNTYLRAFLSGYIMYFEYETDNVAILLMR